MTTPLFATGYELGALSANGGGIVAAITGSPAVQGTYKRTGNYALQINVTGTAASCNVAYNITTAPTCLVGVIYFMWRVAPSAAVRILRGTVAAGSSPAIYFDPADSKIYPYVGTTAGSKSAALTQNQWYRIDFKFDVSTGTTTLDVKLDGTAITQLTLSQTATSFNGLYVGFSTNATGEVYYDDLVFGGASADYPFGARSIVNLTPSADGTHNAGTNVIEANDGTDIGVTTAYDKINSIPPGNTTYIKQVATGTGNYFEVTLSDMPAGKVPMEVIGWLAYMSSGTSSNQFATGVMDGATFREIYGNPTTRADYSESSLFYKSAIITLTTLDETNVNALKIRGGYSNDISPVPYCVDVGIEVAYADPTGVSGAGNIASAEAFGTPSLTSDVTGAGAISSAETLGSPALGASISASAIASAEAFGTPSLTSVVTGAGAISSAETLGALALGASISANAIASAEAFGLSVVSETVIYSISDAGNIAGAEAFGTPSLTSVVTGAGAISSAEALGSLALGASISANAIASAEAFGLPVVSETVIYSISDAGNIASAEAFGASVLTLNVTGAGAISSAEALGSLALGISISTSGINGAEAIGEPSISYVFAVAGITTVEAFGDPTVIDGSASIISNAGAISSTEAFGDLSITLTVATNAILTSEAFGQMQVGVTNYLAWTSEINHGRLADGRVGRLANERADRLVESPDVEPFVKVRK